MYRHSRMCSNEQGSVLALGMLTLTLLTVIGFATTTNGTLESEIARNEKSYQQAFYTAELGLVSGEAIIHTLPSRADLNEGTTPGRYAPGVLSFDHTTYKMIKSGQGTPQPVAWNSTDSSVVTNLPSGLAGAGVVPRYTLAERTFRSDSLGRGIAYGTSGLYYFNVTSRGTSGGNTSHVLLESVYAKRF